MHAYRNEFNDLNRNNFSESRKREMQIKWVRILNEIDKNKVPIEWNQPWDLHHMLLKSSHCSAY